MQRDNDQRNEIEPNPELNRIENNPIEHHPIPEAIPVDQHHRDIDNEHQFDDITIISPFYREYYEEEDLRGFRATTNQVQILQQRIDSLRELDEFQRSLFENNNRSEFDNDCITLNYTGDTHPSRFWYYVSIHEVDDTLETPFYIATHDTDQPDSDYYQSVPTDYRQIIIPLQRNINKREYGRVFFNTETRYVPYHQVTYPQRKQQPVRGYILIDNKEQYHLKYTNPRKNTLYYTKPGGILKRPTLKGYIAETIFSECCDLRNNFYNTYRKGTIASTFFNRISENYNYQIEDWAIDSINHIDTSYDINQYRIHKSRYEYKWEQFSNHIDIVHNNRLRYKYSCIRIQRSWRIRTNNRTIAKHKIIRNWRRYILNNIGTKYTIKLPDNEHIEEDITIEETTSNTIDIITDYNLIFSILLLIITYCIEEYIQNDDRRKSSNTLTG
jgi:hypothetical protein